MSTISSSGSEDPVFEMTGGILNVEDPQLRLTYLPNGAKSPSVEARDLEGNDVESAHPIETPPDMTASPSSMTIRTSLPRPCWIESIPGAEFTVFDKPFQARGGNGREAEGSKSSARCASAWNGRA
ncbi:MAG: hypothetical protein U1E30_03065 [Rhodoblastus sp.]